MSQEQALKAGLLLRTKALAAHIAELRARIGGGRPGLADALELVVARYPPFIESLIPLLDEMDAVDRIRELGILSQHVIERSQRVEEWFARGATLRVPASLFSAVERACAELRLPQKQAVLAIGRADNLETLLDDLVAEFFGSLRRFPLPKNLPDNQFAMIQVPRLEGGDGLWWPLILGHEMAHLKCLVGGADNLMLTDLIDWSAFNRKWPEHVENGNRIEASEFFRRQYGPWLDRWVSELLCDAYTIYRFGPAGVASLAEFLDANGDIPLRKPSHPPGLLRVRLSLLWAEKNVGETASRSLAHASDIAKGSYQETFRDAEAFALLVELVEHAAEVFAKRVETWFTEGDKVAPITTYKSDTNDEAIRACVADLEDGVPPKELYGGVRTTHPDVINAVWAVRFSGTYEDLTIPGRLVSRSLETLEFVNAWTAAGGKLVDLEGHDAPEQLPTGIISRHEIERRLVLKDQQKRLVVTPLLPFTIGEGALDLHLGAKFIVFRKSRTPSFRTLDDIDAQKMQEMHEMGWGETFTLHPGQLALAATLEYLAIPNDLGAQVVTRSSYGRLGLITATAVVVHPNYRGVLTLELLNLGDVPLELTPGERIAQLVFMTVAPEVRTRDKGQTFSFATEPEFSRGRFKTDEAEILRAMARGLENEGKAKRPTGSSAAAATAEAKKMEGPAG